MPQPCILFVDDDPDIHTIVHLILQQAGMEIISVCNGKEALDALTSQSVDLVILDIFMPNLDGLETCRRMREITDTPIILLTAKGLEDDVVKGFEAGADDYIIKPFREKEFIARIKAAMKHTSHTVREKQSIIKSHHLLLELNSHQVIVKERTVETTPLEFRLLRYLMLHPGIVLSKEDLLHTVWGYSKTGVHSGFDLNLIEAAISRLRKKIEENPSTPLLIQTVRSRGYRFGENNRNKT